MTTSFRTVSVLAALLAGCGGAEQGGSKGSATWDGATAKLRGLSDGQRAYQMITVAHPLFRGELAETAKKRGLITEGQAYALKASVAQAVRGAPVETREALANAALEKGLLSNDEHTEIVVEALVPKLPAKK